MPEFQQADRFLQVSTPLGQDKLFLMSFSGREEYSRPFHFHLELLDPSATQGEKGLAASTTLEADILGKPVDFWTVVDGQPDRRFHGIVRRFSFAGTFERGAVFHAEVVPKLWLLTLRSGCKVFQEKSATDIVKAVLEAAGITDFRLEVSGTPATRIYCVQYRETDFDFVHRLLEEEGLHYRFEFEQGKHTLVITDKKPTNDIGGLEFDPAGGALQLMTSWSKEFQLHSSQWTLRDYDFKDSVNLRKAEAKTITKWAGAATSNAKHYDYPADTVENGVLKSFAKFRMEEEEARAVTTHGSSTATNLIPGAVFTVKGHPNEPDATKYQAASVDHAGRDVELMSGDPGEGTAYENRFVALLESAVYRPPRITRRARVDGIQTAKVVGPKGQEIYTDEYGRVRIQFPWDPDGKYDENSSCWVRVAQAWAGDKFGVYFHPRIGDEVVVSFLEGNPDQPLITGSVWNNKHMPPYALPAEQNKSGIKTHSTAKGGADHFNELRFTDVKDKEQIYFHAERDFDRVVENNDTLKVGFDDKDPGSQTIDIFADRTLTIAKGNHAITLKEGNETLTLNKGDRTITLDKGSQTTNIAKGDFKIYAKAGHVVIEAKQSITLKCGDSQFKLEPMKTVLKVAQTTATFDLMNAKVDTSMVDLKGKISAKISGAMTDVKGDAMVKVKGGVVMIN